MERFINAVCRVTLGAFILLLLAYNAHAATVTTRFNRIANNVDVPNPERGVYKLGSYEIETCNANGSSAQGTKFQNIFNSGMRLGAERYYMATALKSRVPTDAEAACQLANALEAANHGVKLLIRYAYTKNKNDDANTKQIVYDTIDKLSQKVWNPSKAMWAYWESGFVGQFAESHDSKIFATNLGDGNCGDMDEFYDFLIPRIPPGRKTTQRKAGYLNTAACAPYNVAPTNPLTGCKTHAAGYDPNDCIMAHSDGVSKNDNYGHTYDCAVRASEQNYWAARLAMVGETDGVAGSCLNQACTSSTAEKGCCLNDGTGTRCEAIYNDTSHNACGGAAGAGDNCTQRASDCSTSMAMFQKMHQATLRGSQDAATAEVWDKWTAGGCVNQIKAQLGYRFVFNSATFDDTRAAGEQLVVTLEESNEGFSNPINERPLEFVLLCQSGACVGVNDRINIPVAGNAQLWSLQNDTTGKPKATPTYQTVTLSGLIPGSAADGVYSLNVAMRDPEPELRYTGGKMSSQAKETPFNILVANGLGCESSEFPCATSDTTDFEVNNTTLGINRIGSVTVSGGGDPGPCVVNGDCNDNKTCTTDTCQAGGAPSAYPVTGRIAFSNDGGRADCDDIGATAINTGLASKTGNGDKVAYMGYADDHDAAGGQCPSPSTIDTSAERFAALDDSTHDIAVTWNGVTSPDIDTSVIHNCTNEADAPGACTGNCATCVTALTAAINASSGGDPLTIICGGAMDIFGRAMNAATSSKRQYVTAISHSTHNEGIERAPSDWTWNEIKAAFTTATYIHILDQNKNLGGDLSDWNSWRTSAGAPAEVNAMRDQIVASGGGSSGSGDVSDAGMTLWFLLGSNMAAQQPTLQNMKDVFTSITTPGDNTCIYTDNSADCTSADGAFCNGTDTCGGGTCSIHTGDPCAAGEQCNEGTDACDAGPDPGNGAAVGGCDETPGSSILVTDVEVPSTNDYQILLCRAGCEEDDSDCDMGFAAATWGSALMQRAAYKSTPPDAAGWRSSVGIFFLVNPTPGTADFKVQMPSAFEGINNLAASCQVLTNMEIVLGGGLPIDEATAGGGGNYVDPRNTTFTVPSIAPADKAVVVDVHGVGNPGSQTTTQGGQAEDFDISCGVATSPTGGSYAGSTKEVSASGATTMGWDFSAAINRDIHAIAVFRALAPNPPTTTVTTTSTTIVEPPTTSTTVEPPTTTTVIGVSPCSGVSSPNCSEGYCAGAAVCVDNAGLCQCAISMEPGSIYLCPECTP